MLRSVLGLIFVGLFSTACGGSEPAPVVADVPSAVDAQQASLKLYVFECAV